MAASDCFRRIEFLSLMVRGQFYYTKISLEKIIVAKREHNIGARQEGQFPI